MAITCASLVCAHTARCKLIICSLCIYCVQVLDIFQKTQAAFPGAEVSTSTLDEFTLALQAAAPRLSPQLKVMTEEIGDTWIYGIASDADKVAEYRALLRMRSATAWKVEEAAYRNFSRLLLKVCLVILLPVAVGLAVNALDAVQYKTAILVSVLPIAVEPLPGVFANNY